MKIETFQKIQQRLIDVTLLPVSFFIAIAIYFWQSLWDQHVLLTAIAFIASTASCVYFLSVNISTRPWVFLKETYLNNKKYKTLRKIQQKKPEENPKGTVTSTTQRPQKQIGVQERGASSKHGHFQFHLDDQKQIQLPSKSHHEAKRQLPSRDFPFLKEEDEQKAQTVLKSSSKFLNQLDPLEMFFYSSKQNEAQKNRTLHQKINSDQINKSEEDLKYQKESQRVKKCISSFTKAVQSQNFVRQQYEQRYESYKKSLQEFQINQQGLQRLVDETKLIIRQKIQQNLKKQFDNLDNIESTLKKHFNVNFKSYKQRSDRKGQNNFQGQTSNKDQSKDGGFNQPLKFNEVLQQCVNLLHHHYFNFQYIGEIQKIDEVKSELKSLIIQRIKLDEYLFLKRPLRVERLREDGREKGEFKSEFEEERYFNLIKLKNLAQILGEKKIAQENLLKEFFSTQRTFLSQFDEPFDQINDERNIEFLVRFMIRTFQEKLSSANASDYIQIRMTKPNFEDHQVNFIWIKRVLGMKSHYNIEYSCITKDESRVLGEKGQQKSSKTKLITCCPGQNNVWVCFAFIRYIISKIGLRKQEYSMIKDPNLKKDFQRLVQLIK